MIGFSGFIASLWLINAPADKLTDYPMPTLLERNLIQGFYDTCEYTVKEVLEEAKAQGQNTFTVVDGTGRKESMTYSEVLLLKTNQCTYVKGHKDRRTRHLFPVNVTEEDL